MNYEVKVMYAGKHSHNGEDTHTFTFTDERKAKAFMREECKWEKTAWVECPQLSMLMVGDYEWTRANT